jgi:hypothetical protein
LVPSETANAPSAVLIATTSLLAAMRWVAASSKKVSAKRSNCSRCAPTLPGCAEPSSGLSSATSRRPDCTVMSPWRTPATTAHATVRASFSVRESPWPGVLNTSSEKAAAAWARVVPELAIAPDNAKPRKTATTTSADAVPIRAPRPAVNFICSASWPAARRRVAAGPLGRDRAQTGAAHRPPCNPLLRSPPVAPCYWSLPTSAWEALT